MKLSNRDVEVEHRPVSRTFWHNDGQANRLIYPDVHIEGCIWWFVPMLTHPTPAHSTPHRMMWVQDAINNCSHNNCSVSTAVTPVVTVKQIYELIATDGNEEGLVCGKDIVVDLMTCCVVIKTFYDICVAFLWRTKTGKSPVLRWSSSFLQRKVRARCGKKYVCVCVWGEFGSEINKRNQKVKILTFSIQNMKWNAL